MSPERWGAVAIVAWTAVVLAAWLLRRRSRAVADERRRAEFGTPITALEELPDGEEATVAGKLVLDGEGCSRFEDGAPAAATSASDGSAIASARAPGELRIALEGGALVLIGPIEVSVGSFESRTGARFAQLRGRVRERLADLGLGREAPLAFRSIAAGDHVVAKGVVRRLPAEEAHGYRTSGLEWALTRSDAAPVRIASLALPRVRGPVRATLAGIRDARPIVAFAAAVLAGHGVAALGALFLFERAAPLRFVSVDNDTRLAPEECARLSELYRTARDQAGSCTSDADCSGETRGTHWFALDGCSRYLASAHPRRGEVDALAERWLGGGCADDYDTCPPAAPAICEAARCTELPPNGLPRDWVRHSLPHVFSLFLPPDLLERDAHPIDSVVLVWKGSKLSVGADYGWYSDSFTTPTDGEREVKEVTLAGRPARRARTRWPNGRFGVAVHFPEAPLCEVCGPGLDGETVKLTVHIDCADEAACADGDRILDSIRFP